jgi:menaquinone-dependent protoporphyrinogen oxidase
MKVLVTAASKHGATTEIADWIDATLRAEGIDSVARHVELVESLEGFDAVILGSAVYAGHWLEPATAFVRRFEPELRERRVYLFSSGPVGDPPKPEGLPADVERFEAATGAIEHRVFPGRIERRLLGFGERAIVAALRVPDMDSRPRDEIEAWAREIAAAFVAPPLPAVRG